MTRLFPTITPSRYSLTLTPDLTSATFTGEETIAFHTAKPTKTFTFHSVEITVTNIVLLGKEKELVPTISYDSKNGRVTFAFEENLPAGEYELQLSYKGLLGEKMKGWYRSEFILNNQKHYIAATQFEEIGARQALVCIDEPSAKAVFDVTLIVPKYMTGVSNTIAEEEVMLDGHKKLHFSPTPRMSTYLLAFIVGELESITTTSKGGIEVRAHATPGKKKQLAFALDVAARSLDFYAEYFAIPYPLPVLDLIALPDFDAGAMENWGAVTFRESALLVDSEKSSLANKQWVALVVAHELAHMWFGNLVTMEWWTHLWLNEGFACYIEYLATNALFPKWDMWKQFAATEHASALALDSLVSSHPIEVPIDNENEVKEIFDEISYAKGANVIQMLATFLGKDVFRDGLRKYLSDNAYGNTVTQQLWEAFEQVSNKPVKDIMHNWTQKVGYPIIAVLEKEKAWYLSQERFFASSIEREKNTTTTLWKIPVTLLEEKRGQTILLEEKVSHVAKKSPWIKVNKGETSLLRAVYEEKQYEKVGQAVQKGELEAVDRMGIVRDIFDSSEAGVLSSVAALRLLPFYKKDKEYIVWASIASGMMSLENILQEKKKIVEKFHAFGRKIFVDIANQLGWEKKPTDAHTDILLRSIALHALGNFGDKKVIASAKKLFQQHFAGEIIDADIRGVVFALVAKNGGEKEWDVFYTLYKKEELHQEKNRLMMALSSFASQQLIAKTLEWSLFDSSQLGQVRLQDKSRILALLFQNPNAQNMTWQFIKKHWATYQKIYGGLHGFTRVIDGAGSIASPALRDDIAQFFARHPQEDLTRTVSQVLEKIDANIAWLQRDVAAIEKFLHNEV